MLFRSPPDTTGLIAIGNPPFGRNNALSVPFFNHAATMCDTIAFIVPRSWRKWSVTNRLDLGFRCVRDVDLHVDYVDAHGDPVAAKGNLRTCLQIWQQSHRSRQPVVIPPSRWVQKCAPEDADVAIRVFGYGCGTVLTKFPRVPNTTLAFLKVRNRTVIPTLRDIDFSVYFDNVAYTQALAFSEIRHALRERLGD